MEARFYVRPLSTTNSPIYRGLDLSHSKIVLDKDRRDTPFERPGATVTSSATRDPQTMAIFGREHNQRPRPPPTILSS